MRKSIFILLGVIFFQCAANAQIPGIHDAAKIKLQLEKLQTLGRVLYVAAHPDDENTELLAYLTNQKHYRTAYLSLTRGDGGQNLVGNEQGPYIGLIRTEELLAARQNDGAEQFFSRAYDFGFSKTAKETFQFWGHQRILADVVWRIRKFRPDVIITRFPEDKRAGHGNHWASAILAHEAFEQAGDPSKFPNQLKYVDPWQPKRILWNTYKFGSFNTTSPDQFHIDIGKYNPLLGKGYGEIAAEGRSMHKSQGFGTLATFGHHTEYFKTMEGSKPQKELFDGVQTGWESLEGGKKVGNLITKALKQYEMDHPEKSIPLLFQIRSAIAKLSNNYWKKQKTQEVNRLIIACSGIHLSAYCDHPYVVAGQNLDVQTQVVNRSKAQISLESVVLVQKKKELHQSLSENDLKKASYQVKVPQDLPISQPYWLRKPHHKGYYEISEQQLVGWPQNPPSLKAYFKLKIEGDTLSVTRPINYIHSDPVKGEEKVPMVVTPPVTANIADEVYVFTSKERKDVSVKLKGFKKGLKGHIKLITPTGFEVKNNNQPFVLEDVGAEKTVHFSLSPKHKLTSSIRDTLSIKLSVNGKVYSRGIKVIDHGYIPTITVFPKAVAKVAAMSLKTKGHTIGYIMGAGDKVPASLEQMGYQVTLLDDKALKASKLTSYDAVIIGIRAYNTRKNLKYAQGELMKYVKQGGTLLVQYNKNYNLVDVHPGPYPFHITKKRVTDEHSKVKFLLPHAVVLNQPNKITKEDFKGWIQERGVYFVDSVSAHYRQPLAMHDPGEAPLKGSLIICDYGKGKFVYTGLAFFRQLPAGVPGAYRLFANLIAKKD